MTEKQIETRMARVVKAKGGLFFKFQSPGNSGVPDRIILTPTGRVVFVELKTETGSLQKIQRWQIEQMRKRSADVRVLYGWEQAQTFLNELFRIGGNDK